MRRLVRAVVRWFADGKETRPHPRVTGRPRPYVFDAGDVVMHAPVEHFWASIDPADGGSGKPFLVQWGRSGIFTLDVVPEPETETGDAS